MKLRYFTFLIFIPLVIACSSSMDASMVVGTYNHQIVANLGGFNISAYTELTIRKDGPGDYKYEMTVTTMDDMYGGTPRQSHYSGNLESEGVVNNQWKFVGGDFGERGAYVLLPEEGWSTPPKFIIVGFAEGRGDTMYFDRK